MRRPFGELAVGRKIVVVAAVVHHIGRESAELVDIGRASAVFGDIDLALVDILAFVDTSMDLVDLGTVVDSETKVMNL